MLGLVVAAAGFERCPELVGFAAKTGSSEQGTGIAQVQGSFPTHGDEAAMNGALGLGPFRAVSVAYKTNDKSKIQVIAHVSHQITTGASGPRTRQTSSSDNLGQRRADRGADQSARMVETNAPVPSAREVSRTISDVVPARPASVVTQWMVVTTWQGGVGTRTVITTAQVTAAGEQESGAASGSGGSEQVVPQPGPRYAAVPVRGGWLFFQL